MVSLASLSAGDRVEFVRPCDFGYAPDDPLYVEPVPAGLIGHVEAVGEDHVRVRMDDPGRWPQPVLLWTEGRFPDAVGNSLACLRKL